MKQKVALKIKVTFGPEGERILDGQSKILNWTYNQLLEIALKLRDKFIETGDKQARNTLYSERGLRNLLPRIKKEHLFLKSVHSSPVKNAALRLSGSIRDRQKSKNGTRKGKVTGFPRFRSVKKKWFSLLYDEPNKGFKVSRDILCLSLGVDEKGKRRRLSGRLEKPLKCFNIDRVLNLRIVKQHGQFYAVFGIEKEVPDKKKIKKAIALDPNHKNLSYGVGSDAVATEIANPWFLKKLDRHIDTLKTRRDRCQRKSKRKVTEAGKEYWLPSRRWAFFHSKLENLYRIRRDQTKTYLHTIANRLYREYDLVAIGDYTPSGGGLSRGMRRAMNNESLIGRFKDVLSWVALKSGKHFEEWDERGSTKTCHSCGFKHEKSIDPSIRHWKCPHCGLSHVRDENAAINGLKITVKNKEMHGSCRLDAVASRRAWRFTGLGIDEISGASDSDIQRWAQASGN